uniref:Uncharacterized protein n=1 Tax=Setaria viridis TaxID=4556 RepID=A0A4U6UD74_SETVI|nr:hypothetical protein SEVIR_5G052300v2 [Setaria viridis]
MHGYPQEGLVGDHQTWIRIPVFGDKSIPVFGDKSMMLQQHAFFRTSFVARGDWLADFPANTCVAIRVKRDV